MTSRVEMNASNILNALYASRQLDGAIRDVGEKVVGKAQSNLRTVGSDEAAEAADPKWLRFKKPQEGPGVNDARFPVKAYKRYVRVDKSPAVGRVEFHTGLVVSNHWLSRLLEVGSARRPVSKFLSSAARSSGADAWLFDPPRPR